MLRDPFGCAATGSGRTTVAAVLRVVVEGLLDEAYQRVLPVPRECLLRLRVFLFVLSGGAAVQVQVLRVVALARLRELGSDR